MKIQVETYPHPSQEAQLFVPERVLTLVHATYNHMSPRLNSDSRYAEYDELLRRRAELGQAVIAGFDFLAEVQPETGLQVGAQYMVDSIREPKPLSPRDINIFEARHGLRTNCPRTLEYVGVEFKVSRERVRQIMARYKSKLSWPDRAEPLAQVLETLRSQG